MRTIPLLLLILSLCAGCANLPNAKNDAWTNTPGKPLIVLSAPSVTDDYYAEVFDDIIAYDIAFANRVVGKDNIIIL